MIPQGAAAPAAAAPPGALPILAAEESAGSCRNVSVRFITDSRTTTALENVSFVVERGGFLSLLGPSGCGKSTLLRVVADLIAPTSGQVSVLGMSPQEARQKRSLGFVFQDATLLPWATATDNVFLPLRLRGMAREQAMPLVRAALERVGLYPAAFRLCCSWSPRARSLATRSSAACGFSGANFSATAQLPSPARSRLIAFGHAAG